jgi:GAF domain-containing protein
LVPVLREGEEAGDLDTLAAWRVALMSTLAYDLPHDLFALWLYPDAGGIVLIGPSELAADSLAVPEPLPRVPFDEVAVLEAVVRRAGYRSVMALVVTHGGRDVGLMLWGALAEGAYDADRRRLLGDVAARVAAQMARAARLWAKPVRSAATHDPDQVSAMLGELAEECDLARGPADIVACVSRALDPLTPHDRIELLIPGPSGERWFRLGTSGGTPHEAEPDAVLRRDRLDLAHLLAESGQILERDADSGFSEILFGLGSHDVPPRSIAGMLVTAADRPVACLVLGAEAPARYSRRDIRLLAKVTALIAPKVEPLVTAWHLRILRRHMLQAGSAASQLGRIAEQLAGASDLGSITRRFAEGVGQVLVFDQIRFTFRLGDEARVVVVSPGETRPLAELPRVPVAGTSVGLVISGTEPHLLLQSELHADLLVPLRVGGRIIGALTLAAGHAATLQPGDIAVAQQLADLVAPHLELHRQAAVRKGELSDWRRR